ncbi:hypothetical protein SAMN04490357_0015 [Streptomyces misionensis]|uniref:Uncharacterized protein n=1 Tax=Streptomyces misionensis TaxID=67331 RepID=A0A1H4I718_9ACTN|nr:hypothetical protein [Streptomyces misionensis]SEB29556.1 hypothetical protein SAMN04490357_0015 [Streptomyces misionensis]
MIGETPASSDDEDEKEAAERRRERQQRLWQILLDWSPVLAVLAKIVIQRCS